MARFLELRRPGADKPAIAGVSVDGQGLAARLHEIAAGAVEAIDGLEPALHAIIEATGAAAGAVCLFDARREVLRLAAEEGLSDEGCRQLRTVRRGDIASWDMPLHGLMNRRAYLIESAAQNRYVPPLVEAGAAVRTVACLPVYAGSIPVGSLVLITRTPRAFTERDLGGLQQPLRELAQLIEAVRRQASERATAVAPPSAPPPPQRSAPFAEPEAALADAGHDDSLAAALAAAQRENSRLATELERLRAETPRDAGRLSELAAEIDRLRAQLAESEAGAAHEHRVREEMEAALARGSSGGHAELQVALDAARRAETARAAMAADNARLTAELERLRAGTPHEDLASEHAAEIDRLRARLAESEAGAAHEHRAREQLEAALERGASAGQLELRHALESARQAEAAGATLVAENARLHDELERWRGEAAHAGGLRAALAQAEAEQARLAAALENAAAERAEQARAETNYAQAKAAEHEAAMERVRARLAEAEATAAREERARKALDAAAEHDAGARSDDVRQALETARVAEEARDAAATGLAAARVDLTAARAQLEAFREEAAGAHREIARLAAHEQAAREQQERLERELEERRRGEHDLGMRLEERARELEARAAETAATTTRLETAAAECDQLRGAMATLEAERDRLKAQVEGAGAARAQLEEALSGALNDARGREHALTVQLETHGREAEALRNGHAAEVATTNARLETLVAECDQLRSAAEALQAERDRLAADVEGGAAARARLEEALAREVDEARRREQELVARFEEREREAEAIGSARAAETAAAIARVETVVAECDQLRAALAALETERAAAIPAAPATVTPAPAPRRAPAPAAAPAPDVPSELRRMFVVDVDRSWERLDTQALPVTVVGPESVVGRVAELSTQRIMVNLTTPRALEVLLELRAAGCSARFWACLADPTGGRALPLGLIEPAARGLDPEAVLTSLGQTASRGTRVVTVGEDVDAFVSLRQALARQGMSVSMAWNAKQAEELLPLVRPSVVVLDLDLPARDACGIAAQLGACDPPPTTVLVAGSQDRATGFAAALAEPARAHQLIPLDKLVMRFLGRNEKAPDAPR
ncbi:MAG TPA: GAF domain-containing protein [Candidatus Nitrosopolaris sp.]|nr:GAF domain-containing protein [Candidatus Nitrosopolaris sp.]